MSCEFYRERRTILIRRRSIATRGTREPTLHARKTRLKKKKTVAGCGWYNIYETLRFVSSLVRVCVLEA